MYVFNDISVFIDITDPWPHEARDHRLMEAMTAKAIPSALVVCWKGQLLVRTLNQTEMSK